MVNYLVGCFTAIFLDCWLFNCELVHFIQKLITPAYGSNLKKSYLDFVLGDMGNKHFFLIVFI